MPSKSPFTDSVWTRPPRRRGGQPSLSREQIVRAAIELLDAEGIDGLSMRRLGTKLGSGATSLYWHVAHKDELLELAVDEVLGEIYVPEVGDTAWRMGASILASGMRMTLLRHPWVIGLLGVRPNLGPNALRMGERTMSLLTAAGFAGTEIAHVSSMLMAQAIGSATMVSAVTATSRRSGRSVAEMVEDVEPHLEQIAAGHPEYDGWRRANQEALRDVERLWDEGFAFGLDRLLDGLEAWLARARG
jgi:AcrR family transcriptional regulator